MASSGSAGSSGSTSGGSAYSSSPWQLMGRMVSEQRVALQYDTQLNQGLVHSAAARASGLDYEEFQLRLQVGGWVAGWLGGWVAGWLGGWVRVPAAWRGPRCGMMQSQVACLQCWPPMALMTSSARSQHTLCLMQ